MQRFVKRFCLPIGRTLRHVNFSRLLMQRLSISLGPIEIFGASEVQLTDTISFDNQTVALPAAALLLVLVLLITAITGGVPG